MSEAKNQTEKVLEWMAYGEPGRSSETMAFRLLGMKPRQRESHPLDPADFNRCLKLLKAVPELRDKLPEMKAVSPAWSAIVDRWSELEESFIDEVGWDWSNGQSAPKTYALMKEIGC